MCSHKHPINALLTLLNEHRFLGRVPADSPCDQCFLWSSLWVLSIPQFLPEGGLLSFGLDAGRLVISQYPEGPATGHLDKGFFFFVSLVYLSKMLGCFPILPSCLYMLHM
jgi:hypothetical protein